MVYYSESTYAMSAKSKYVELLIIIKIVNNFHKITC